MGTRYRFERMHLSRSPGFRSPPFGTLDSFSPGLNILYGPNGIGKSSLIRAMRALLTKTKDGSFIDAEAIVKGEKERWVLSLDHGQLSQIRGESGERSTLPGRNDTLSDAYFFGLHELLTEVGDNPLFVTRVQSEMQGGIDLEAARSKSDAKTRFSLATIGESQRVSKAKKAVQELKSSIAAQSSLFEEIRQIEVALEEEPALLREEQLLNDALTYLRRRDEAVSLEQQIASYDARLAHLSATTEQQAETLHELYENAVEEEREAREAVAEAEAQIKGSAVDAQFLDDEESPAEIQARIDALQKERTALDAARTKLREATAALSRWEEELSWLVEGEPEEATLKEMVSRLLSLAQSCEPLRTRLSVAEQLQRSLGSVDETASARLGDREQAKGRVADLITLTARLEGMPKEKPKNRVYAIILPLFALSALLTLVWRPSALIGALAALILFFIARTRLSNPLCAALEQEIEQLRSRLTSIHPAEDWSLEALGELLEALAGEIGRLRAQEAKNERIKAGEVELHEAQRAWQKWLDAWQDAASALRLAPSPLLEGAQFFHFSEKLVTWLERKEALAVATANEEDARASWQRAKERLTTFCALGERDDDRLIEEARNLAKNIAAVQALVKALSERSYRLARAEAALQRSSEKLKAFYREAGVDFGDLETVRRLCVQWKGYAQLVEDLTITRRALDGFDAAIRTAAEESDSAELTVRLQQTERALTQIREQKEERTKLRERQRLLSSSDALEKADDELQSALEALEAHRQEAVQGRIIQALYEQIKEERQRDYQPEVLKRASQWLLKITHGRYGLSIGEDNFIALDTLSDTPYQLVELSSGTRIQLLFSIRMAFLELLEASGEYRMPLFFDELMANSDDERSLAIAEAIATITGERQVFYATAQADEVEKLKAVVKENIAVFDLEAIAKKTAIERHPFVAPTVGAIRLIDPLDDYNAYAEALGVAQPALFEPVGHLHSWYLCLTSRELYDLLKRNLERAGQAASMDSTFQRRLRLLEEAASLAETGRGRIMAVSDLSDESFPIRRDVGYYREIVAFLKEGGRSGNDLVAALEERTIRGMRESARTQIVTWLHEERYASDEQKLGGEEILVKLAQLHKDLDVESDEHYIVRRYLGALELL